MMDSTTVVLSFVGGALLGGFIGLLLGLVINKLFGVSYDDEKTHHSSKVVDTGYRIGGQKVTQEIANTYETYSSGCGVIFWFSVAGFCLGIYVMSRLLRGAW